jgi:hypothetical protein
VQLAEALRRTIEEIKTIFFFENKNDFSYIGECCHENKVPG